MRVISVSTLKAFWEQPQYQDSEQPLRAWYAEMNQGSWTTPAQLKAQYGNASILKSGRVVFNIKGNDYRLVVSVAFAFGAMYVKFIGTHKQYDQIDANTVEIKP